MKISISNFNVPVRNWTVALKKRSQDIETLYQATVKLSELMDTENREDQYDIYRFFDEVCNISFHDFNQDNDLYALIRLAKQAKDMMFTGSIDKNNLKYMAPLVGDIATLGQLKYPQPLLDKERLAEKKAGDFSWEVYFGPETLRIIRSFMALPNLFETINQSIGNLSRFHKQYLASQQLADAVNRHSIDGTEPDVPHEDTEILYHATGNLRHLIQHGFSSKRPSGHRGLGELGGLSSTVSLTYDYKIAMEISRALKEIWMIVHGKLREPQILRMMKKSRIDLKDCPNRGERAPQTQRSVKQLVELYNCWLWLNKSKVRENPVFGDVGGLADFLKGRDIKDIGVVKVWANLEGAKFNPAEREYRVAPQAIQKVERHT